MPTLSIHVVSPTATHTHTIIFLHGRGSNAKEFASEFFESQASDDRFLTDIFPSYKWVFPCAAIRYAGNEQEEMHQWFDIASVREPHHRPEIQLEGLRESVQGIRDIIGKEAEEIGGYEKLFVAGISQGCATGIIAALTEGNQLAGFIGISSWLPFPVSKKLHLEVYGLGTAVQMPVLLEHAEDDGVVPIVNGRELSEGLRGIGMKVKWKKYVNGGHWVNEPEGIDDMVSFMKRYDKIG
ncbi:alpha/beta-hydrolase [Periconia macrospinosa]|uniref:Alpha/beta-hydrolase n=1 Tax=Periconia macrospinosa TaxID=97972 RepID=A0A2V1D2Y0_9PLEO|nr:alpha/beta-hydrolase [Periconia macrospinosa]